MAIAEIKNQQKILNVSVDPIGTNGFGIQICLLKIAFTKILVILELTVGSGDRFKVGKDGLSIVFPPEVDELKM